MGTSTPIPSPLVHSSYGGINQLSNLGYIRPDPLPILIAALDSVRQISINCNGVTLISAR